MAEKPIASYQPRRLSFFPAGIGVWESRRNMCANNPLVQLHNPMGDSYLTRDDMTIEIDMRDALADVSVRQLIEVANGALNRLPARDLAEVCFDAGLKPLIGFADKRQTQEQANAD